MVSIRLRRKGRKNRPYYDVVAADKHSPRDGKFIELLGTYDPVARENNVVLKAERIRHWLKCGAQPTDTVRSFFKKYLPA